MPSYRNEDTSGVCLFIYRANFALYYTGILHLLSQFYGALLLKWCQVALNKIDYLIVEKSFYLHGELGSAQLPSSFFTKFGMSVN